GVVVRYASHLSLVLLEMASGGMVVVSNTFGNKTAAALRDLSPNLVGAEPNISGVAAALTSCSRRIDDVEARVAGAGFAWPRDWNDSFDEKVMARVLEFLRSA